MSDKPQRAYVHTLDGQLVAVYLIPNELATPELDEGLEKLSRQYGQSISNVFPYHCTKASDMLDIVREYNLPDEEDEED